MSQLHLIREGAGDEAAQVIRAQVAQGDRPVVVLVDASTRPDTGTTCQAVGDCHPDGVTVIDWSDVVTLMFTVDTVITW